MMTSCGAGFDGDAVDAAPSAIYYPHESHSQSDPWTWESMNFNVLESDNFVIQHVPEESMNFTILENEHLASQHLLESVEAYEFSTEISTSTESETDSSYSTNKSDKPFQCGEDGCKLVFKSKSSLNRHWRTKHEHGGLAKFTCSDCEGVSFIYHSDLLVHQRTAHEAGPPAKRSIPCLQCSAMFRTSADLDTHIARVHEKLKTYECQYCHDKFDREFALQMHIKRRHSMKRDFQCPYCRKMFANLYDLVHFHCYHCVANVNRRTYQCALCPQAYRHATSLSRHKRFAHSNATVADVRQSQLKLIVCGRQHTSANQNHTMTKTIEDQTLGSIKGLFAERQETLNAPVMDISGDLNLMFTQDVPTTSQACSVWSSTNESDFSDSGFLSG